MNCAGTITRLHFFGRRVRFIVFNRVCVCVRSCDIGAMPLLPFVSSLLLLLLLLLLVVADGLYRSCDRKLVPSLLPLAPPTLIVPCVHKL